MNIAVQILFAAGNMIATDCEGFYSLDGVTAGIVDLDCVSFEGHPASGPKIAVHDLDIRINGDYYEGCSTRYVVGDTDDVTLYLSCPD